MLDQTGQSGLKLKSLVRVKRVTFHLDFKLSPWGRTCTRKKTLNAHTKPKGSIDINLSAPGVHTCTCTFDININTENTDIFHHFRSCTTCWARGIPIAPRLIYKPPRPHLDDPNRHRQSVSTSRPGVYTVGNSRGGIEL